MTAADKVNNDMNNTGARKVSGLLANFPPKVITTDTINI